MGQVVYFQSMKGKVLDASIQIPIFGAKISLLEDSSISTVTDLHGRFQLDSLPVGRYTVLCVASKYEYQEQVVLLTSAKQEEVVFNLNLASFKQVKTAKIKSFTYTKPKVNSMAPISSHSFGVEETQNFAAAVNDPARMATSFAGVVGADDGNNAISIRGNAPSALLWRIEGIDIPAPNHFSSFDGASGGISLVSSQLLSQSDFFTGAFSPEYGNSIGGVFDLRMRKGNSEKREHTLQAGILGVDLATEGPLGNKGGSYLINYRYSTLDLLSKIGFDLFGGLLSFQDLSFNISLPTEKAGDFSIFGMGGLSSQYEAPVRDSNKWEFEGDRYHFKFISNTGILGLRHQKSFNQKTTWRNVIALSANKVSEIDMFIDDNYKDIEEEVTNVENKKISWSSIITKQVNGNHSFRAGAYLHKLYFETEFFETDVETFIKSDFGNNAGATEYAQAFAQWKWQLHRKVQIISGLHGIWLGLNNKSNIEPRLAMVYKPKRNQHLSLGLGMHSQMQLPGVYFTNAAGSNTNQNKDLDFTKASHVVLGYEYWFGKKLRAKLETYYQHLSDVPIGTDAVNPYSILNLDWGINPQELINEGEGRNRGVELTLEKIYSKRFYGLLSASLFRSEFKTQSNIWYRTRYDAGHSMSSTLGKEFKLKNNNLLGLNLKTSWYGGFRIRKIDLEKSKQEQKVIIDNTVPLGNKLPNYFRVDVKFSYRINHSKFNSFWSLDLQNATNRMNVGGQYYDVEKEKIQEWYLTSLLPVISYKIEF
jgi:hypothetical protein